MSSYLVIILINIRTLQESIYHQFNSSILINKQIVFCRSYSIIKRMKVILSFLALLIFLQARLFQTSMKFSYMGANDGWVYLDKMSFAPGTVQFRMKTTTKGIPYGQSGKIIIQAVPQYMWQQQKQRKCRDISRQPYLQHRISLNSGSQDFTRQSFQIEQQTMYYFVMKDCLRNLKAQYNNTNLNLNVRLHLLNNNSQLGEEQDHWYIVIVIFVTGSWLVYFYNGKMKGSNFQTHHHRMLMFAGIATQISSLTWKSIGFCIYVYTGADYLFFHIIYLLMHSISESLVISLIILIGFGWTINFKTGKDLDIYIPIIGCLAFINAILTILTKFQSNLHDRHHIFDNVSGSIIIGYRIILLLVFGYAVFRTYNQSRTKVRNFIIVFALLGALYIAALPIIIFIGNNFIEAKNRHQFVFVAMQTLKCVSNVGLSIMLNREKSYYNEISYEKRSFVPEDSRYF